MTLFSMVLSLIYYDQRIRQEGFDIEMMMDAAGMNEGRAATMEDAGTAVVEAGEPFA